MQGWFVIIDLITDDNIEFGNAKFTVVVTEEEFNTKDDEGRIDIGGIKIRDEGDKRTLITKAAEEIQNSSRAT